MKERLKSKFPGFFRILKRNYYRLRRLNPFISSRFMYIGNGRYFDFKTKKKREIKPNLIIIGAAKSGTTSLHHYLDQHPQIFMSTPNKEPQYLMPIPIARKYYEKSDMTVRDREDIKKNHMLRGYKGEKIFGESTTTYTRARSAATYSIADQLKKYVGSDVKIIYLLRHPIARIVSNYLHKVRDGRTRESLDEDVKNTKAYVFTSLYYYQISHYLDVVPKERIMIVLQDSLTDNPDNTLQQACKFLGINTNFKFSTAQNYNTSGNRLNYKNDELKFSSETFIALKESIEKDNAKLEKLFKIKLPWELKESDWVKQID